MSGVDPDRLDSYGRERRILTRCLHRCGTGEAPEIVTATLGELELDACLFGVELPPDSGVRRGGGMEEHVVSVPPALSRNFDRHRRSAGPYKTAAPRTTHLS